MSHNVNYFKSEIFSQKGKALEVDYNRVFNFEATLNLRLYLSGDEYGMKTVALRLSLKVI